MQIIMQVMVVHQEHQLVKIVRYVPQRNMNFRLVDLLMIAFATSVRHWDVPQVLAISVATV